jgi:hypothetical protein
MGATRIAEHDLRGGHSMAGRTAAVEAFLARLGSCSPYVFVTSAATPLAEQAKALHDVISRTFSDAGGWMLDNLAHGGTAHGFADLMQQREAGRLAWDTICQPDPTTCLGLKKPHIMLVRASYPCWAAQGHVFSLDLFNPCNELTLPYRDDEHRLWALLPYPPQLLMTDVLWSALLRAATVVLQPEVAFGGCWVRNAVQSYVIDLTYPHMILRAETLPPQALQRLQRGAAHGSRQWQPTVCDPFDDGRYLFLSLAATLDDENAYLGRAAAKALRRPYAPSKLVTARSYAEE